MLVPLYWVTLCSVAAGTFPEQALFLSIHPTPSGSLLIYQLSSEGIFSRLASLLLPPNSDVTYAGIVKEELGALHTLCRAGLVLSVAGLSRAQ